MITYAILNAVQAFTAPEAQNAAAASAWAVIPVITWVQTANVIQKILATQATSLETITCVILNAALTPTAPEAQSVAAVNA